MSFDEYRNRTIATLGKEAGETFYCFHDPKGLPFKIMYGPIARTFFPGREDEPSDLNVKMQLISGSTGKVLETYLTETLGLKPDVDFERHANGQRGGSRYFNILTDSAIKTLSARAEQVGQASAAERAARQASASRSDGRQ